jgi:hypothetical protein
MRSRGMRPAFSTTARTTAFRTPITLQPGRRVPQCPDATAIDATGVRVIDARPEHGRYVLCNGIVVWSNGRIERPGSGRR